MAGKKEFCMLNNKKNLRLIALAIAAVFILGVAGIAVTQTSSIKSVSAAPSSNIGIVNYQVLFEQHPDTAAAQQTMQSEAEQAKKDFDAKSATMGDKEKQEYYNQLQQRLMLKEQELRGGIFDKINGAVKAVAEAKGLSIVIEKGNVIYGGNDITEEVAKKFK